LKPDKYTPKNEFAKIITLQKFLQKAKQVSDPRNAHALALDIVESMLRHYFDLFRLNEFNMLTRSKKGTFYESEM